MWQHQTNFGRKQVSRWRLIWEQQPGRSLSKYRKSLRPSRDFPGNLTEKKRKVNRKITPK